MPPPAPLAKGTPLTAAANPLRRKQTLLGIAPTTSAEPETTATAEPETLAEPETTATAEPEVARELLVVPAPSDNPLRKQTLLGIAPALPSEPSLDSLPNVEPAPPVIATDAPTVLEVERSASAPVISWPPPAPASVETDEELDLRPKRPRWLLPLGIAAAVGLTVVGVQQLSRKPSPAPLALAAADKAPAVTPSPAPTPSGSDALPSQVADPTPEPSGTEPPLAVAAPSVSAEPAPAPSKDVVRIQVNSDPPGARLFWKGKPIGTTPFVLELAPGEKHAYEMGLPGYNARKVVIDGTKNVINIGLKPEPGTFIGGASRRKP